MGLFGIGDGKMDIVLKDAQGVIPGGTVEATATLTLNCDVKAKGVVAGLLAMQRQRKMRFMNGREESEIVDVCIFKNEQSLDGDKTYLKSASPLTYAFKFAMPAMPSMPAPSGVVGALEQLTGGFNEPIRWYLDVRLDIPWAIAVSKRLQLSVTQQGPQSTGIQ